MIDYEEELKKFEPCLDVADAECVENAAVTSAQSVSSFNARRTSTTPAQPKRQSKALPSIKPVASL